MEKLRDGLRFEQCRCGWPSGRRYAQGNGRGTRRRVAAPAQIIGKSLRQGRLGIGGGPYMGPAEIVPRTCEVIMRREEAHTGSGYGPGGCSSCHSVVRARAEV